MFVPSSEEIVCFYSMCDHQWHLNLLPPPPRQMPAQLLIVLIVRFAVGAFKCADYRILASLKKVIISTSIVCRTCFH